LGHKSNPLRFVFLLAAICMPLRAAPPSPEQRAIDYLVQEVPSWSKGNACFSCHNNGDGVRALYTALRLHYPVPTDSLADSSAWLKLPTQWDKNPGNPAFSDKKLARIQFAAALVAGVAAGSINDNSAIAEAAASLLPDQEKDGGWQVDVGTFLGSPVTYGPTLATVTALQTLEGARQTRFTPSITKATQWLTARKPESVMDAAALLLALPTRKDCLQFLISSQNRGGGWGPQPQSPAEVFDTALSILGLVKAGSAPEAVARGRAYLIGTQLEPGGWPGTTRPSGAGSYAQHISTSAWATLALLATDPKRQ
jgi:Prenyltransferase and squalene oxidase repeat